MKNVNKGLVAMTLVAALAAHATNGRPMCDPYELNCKLENTGTNQTQAVVAGKGQQLSGAKRALQQLAQALHLDPAFFGIDTKTSAK